MSSCPKLLRRACSKGNKVKRPRVLGSDEKALWSRVANTVRPIPKRVPRAEPEVAQPALSRTKPVVPPLSVPDDWSVGSARKGVGKSVKVIAAKPERLLPGAATLDGGWDKGFRRGAIRPERSIDLHGYRLDAAHLLLERALADALADDIRVLLIVTGKERRDPQDSLGAPERRRGIIRASIADWLAHSRHGPMIAAVRNAHPCDGGAGALYVILRRKR